MKKNLLLILIAILPTILSAQWDTLHSGTNTNFRSIDFSSVTNGVVTGNDPTTSYGNIFHTSNGGNQWDLVETGTHGKNDVCFSSLTRGWIACDSGYLKMTNMSGSLWSYGGQIGAKDFYAISFPNDTTGYVGGESGILFRTENDGASWDTLNSGTNLAINDLFFSDAANGWIVGNGGYLAMTSDSGNSWTQIAQPFFGFMNINGIGFSSNGTNAVSVGNQGDAVFTNDAGTNWNSLATGRTTTLNKISFANNLAGVIVGNNGLILRTENGGVTWMHDSVPGVTENLTGICWASDTLAFICGDNGRILKSNSDISSVISPLVNPIDALAFPNPFADELNVSVDLKNSSDVAIEIMDVTGKIVSNANEGEIFSGKNNFHINEISELNAGIYFVRVITNEGSVILPVVKK